MSASSDRAGSTASGEPATRFAEAMRMIEIATSFDAFDRGVTLVEQAAEAGHAEAACTLAAIEAVGAARPRNWNRALDWLEAAAGRGSEHARGQLRLLAGQATSTEGDPAGGWREARGRIDFGRLLAAPAPDTLSTAPRLRVYRQFASPEECRWLIARFRPRLGRAKVWSEAGEEDQIDERRTNSAVEVRLGETDVVIAVLRARISAATRVPESLLEVPQVMRYAVGEEFRPHYDFLDPDEEGFSLELARRGQRLATFLIYLNDEFEGGETAFPKADIAWRGGTGDALLFANLTQDGRPDPLTLHAGLPPTSGEKWIFSQWMRDRAPAEARG